MKKTRQGISRPKKSLSNKPAKPIPAGTPEGGTPRILPGESGEFTAEGKTYRIEPTDHPEPWKIDTPRAMRKAPDIEAVARLGGLPASVKPYELAYRDKDGSLFPTCYGQSTATVTRCLHFGYAKVVDAARGFLAQYADADSSEIRDRVKHLGWVGEEWIEKNILHSARSSAELGAELRDMVIAGIPAVNRWGVAPLAPAENTDDLGVKGDFGPSDIELGRWADELLPQAKQFAGLMRAGRRPEDLRPHFSRFYGEVIDRMPDKTKLAFFANCQAMYQTKFNLLESLANVKCLSGHRLSDLRKKYRRTQRDGPQPIPTKKDASNTPRNTPRNTRE